ncbi:hypothetical protein FIBSPDRAFT_943014 [Athelia psychrophila]|uniref:Uncharacterized protein n=1 Tax=Athelia psychrophila TaxID=1759441 RepID=A0A166WMQ3_9AGAM|nr:hypothetical protein FIBSPDRAFT_943014 [Fibularhizoctonia sp. CBS 109695]
MLRHGSLQGLLLGSKRVNGQFQRSPSFARLYAQGQAIRTLDPSKLQPSDYVKLARAQATISTPDSTFKLGYRKLSKSIPSPQGSSGFLYLSSAADKPQSTWEIRFRVTDSNAPQSFQSGADLLRPDNKPWSIQLRALGSKQYAALWELLLRDGLVDDALLHLRPYNVKQHIQTLDPSQLQPSDHLNLSGTTHSKISTQEAAFRVSYTSINNHINPFPDNARGFLYLHSPPAEPKAMWEIRFRVTDNNCPSSFKSGSDLVYPNKTTWAISLGSLQAHHPEYLPLRNLLIREGLDIDALLATMGAAKQKKLTSIPLIDYSLAQRFRVEFQSTARLGVASRHFEAHPSPGSTQPDQLAIRILEMITPVTISNPEFAHRIPMPQEGELVMRYTKHGPKTGMLGPRPKTLDPRPWTLNAQMTAHPVIQAILRDAAT